MTNKLLYLVIIFLVTVFTAHGQGNLANVIPPSPAASAMQQYGNTDVSLYTGAVNVSIPVHSIILKDLQFPIVLNYSGSGGINIQTIASWVGLGWTLNATGAVSRTIYGLADDKPEYGYMNLPAIPPVAVENAAVFELFASGSLDAEPDKFFYNVNGTSGSFYINKQKQVVQVPLTNNKIIPIFGPLPSGKIIGFDLVTDRGIIYRFNEREEVRSYTPGRPSTDTNYYVSSWYLTSAHNVNNTEAIYFHYEPYQFTQYSEVYTTRIIDNPTSTFLPHYVVTETNAKRLKFITYNESDTIKFVKGSIPRRDLIGEQFLSSIQIDEQDRTRSVDFAYSYFDKNGVVPITSPYTTSNTYLNGYLINGQADGDHFKRLKLDTVYFFNDDRSESLPYTFEYYSQAYLPSRFSYARDHWGFYNGQDGNPGLEPRRRVDLRPILNNIGNSDFAIYGNANREPSAVHAKAGMLTRVIYPSGGSTSYEYELHQSSLKLLPNVKEPSSASLSPITPLDTLYLETINEAFVDLKIRVMGVQLSEHCDVAVTFRNIQTNTTVTYSDFNQGEVTLYMEEGDYEVSYVEQDGIGNCFDVEENFYMVRFQWENEVSTPNKDVGGLRIKRTPDWGGTGNSVKRVYNYTLQNSTLSSGSLVSVPRYGYYEEDPDTQFAIIGFYRMYNTNRPLELTQGSQVGYRRVEVTTEEPYKTGKSVYYYTCPVDFPDFTRGWTGSKYDDEVMLNNGNVEYTYIFPHHDNRDWKRGILFAQIDYEYQGGQFVPVASKENHYKVYAEVEAAFDANWQSKYPMQFHGPEYNKEDFFTNDEANGEGIPKLQGVRTQCNYGDDGSCGHMYVKNYEYFSGRVELVSQTENFYRDQNTVTTTTSYLYQNPQFYYPTKISTSTSQADSVITVLKYTFDHASLAGLSATNKSALETLESRNAIAEPMERATFKGNKETQRQRTNFVVYDSAVLSDNIFASISGEALEQEVDFVEYDGKGNLLEYKGKDEISIAIKYGYNNLLPVAKTVNAHYGEIFYESFEETGTDGAAKTGKKYYTGDYTVELATANPNSILSYWYWQNNSWHYKQVSYTGGSYVLTDGDRIDEVRIRPKEGMMTTYTYDPGVGFTSVTDQNNQATYYEYDSFGRLTIVRDHHGNILQQTEYQIVNNPTYEP